MLLEVQALRLWSVYPTSIQMLLRDLDEGFPPSAGGNQPVKESVRNG